MTEEAVPRKFGLWDFSLEIYALPGVATACLALQERHGMDVNLLLFAVWLASGGRAIGSAEELRAIAGQATRWHQEVVRPLRRVRQLVKRDRCGLDERPAETFRSGVKRLELEAERLEQWLLFGAAAVITADPGQAGVETCTGTIAWRNLMLCFEAVERKPGAEDMSDIDILVRAGASTGS
jgi:uncharacterized protein (TIGR02444 family)